MQIKEKSKKLKIHHLGKATGVMATVPSQAPVLVNVLLAVVMIRLGQIKVFSQFNKLAPNVEVQVKKFLSHVKIAGA